MRRASKKIKLEDQGDFRSGSVVKVDTFVPVSADRTPHKVFWVYQIIIVDVHFLIVKNAYLPKGPGVRFTRPKITCEEFSRP